MRVIVALVGDMYKFPPVISLLNALMDSGIDSVVVSTKPSGNYTESFKTIKFEVLQIDYDSIQSPIKKMMSIPKVSKELWDKIDKHYNGDSVIWVVTDVTLKYLGNRLLGRNYILHLLELSQDLLYYKKIPFLKLDAIELGNKAMATVVPEYNRAHIMAAWWHLEKLPFVLPNKPFDSNNLSRNAYIEDDTARSAIESIGDKKIILYQGILNNERPLDNIIKAADSYDGKYAFVIMSGDKNIYSDIKSNSYFFIPYVRAPKHLEITSHAYLGVLSYVPTYSSGYSPLNALYCAPNKTFEFSRFGVPMIGNDIPGLRFLFETERIGKCFEDFTPERICDCIDEIEKSYESYSFNSLAYYKKCDYSILLKKIIDYVSTSCKN